MILLRQKKSKGAELDDGTAILIEMHMYGLGELKAKTKEL